MNPRVDSSPFCPAQLALQYLIIYTLAKVILIIIDYPRVVFTAYPAQLASLYQIIYTLVKVILIYIDYHRVESSPVYPAQLASLYQIIYTLAKVILIIIDFPRIEFWPFCWPFLTLYIWLLIIMFAWTPTF